MKNLLLMLTAFTAVLNGCDSSAPPQSPGRQDHPVGHFVLQLKGHYFHVELADTFQRRRQGLAGREYLPPDAGMLFVYPTATRTSMWMKGCKIPLDVLFFDGNKRLINFHTMPVPSPGQPNHTLPTYPSDKPAKYALEVPAGTTARLRLKPGAAISFSPELLKALDKGTE
ncbi:MAG: DUF192 domain-containing protein [Phycisphaerae bacterium]|nr:DUF192 domain-containing protein [Phycisphaerae bacterium]